ncbi:hypothetical protein TNCV_3589371 [Trichonephila clavipes]|nr:hypothetical protein TNCV_3589371 [Trichonephila clavipes]
MLHSFNSNSARSNHLLPNTEFKSRASFKTSSKQCSHRTCTLIAALGGLASRVSYDKRRPKSLTVRRAMMLKVSFAIVDLLDIKTLKLEHSLWPPLKN